MNARPALDYFLTCMSPYAYLGHRAFLALAQRQGVAVRYRPVRLLRQFEETGGLPLGKRAPARQRYRLLELQRWRAFRELPLNLAPKFYPVDAEHADRCILALLDAGHDPGEFVFAVLRALWADELDIADRTVLEGLLAQAGIAEVESILDAAQDPRHGAALDANTRDAIALDLPGVPGYVRDGEAFWGQDRLDLLEHAIASGRAPYRPG
ncbi:2-hydroxychromene-2-carboxylate isomerase [Coralloluteibacterium stylophorae]|uniref:2-hydroxychromene-2-carboxylate isomerase n=1 Tax=Coralloluteibacterium stylophorae TaxID=1776034 RepID=A0AAP2C7Z3_9GAMM|nr:2-hydroxychromene-2-carboxylate isomerase [Coralloluteibacterium stylophorae]MBS7456053.1 2-hydroxychromene-2-carboxylate isomerase [Coralloluteibacterium stylophorae]